MNELKHRGSVGGFLVGAVYALVCGYIFTLGEKYSLAFVEFVSMAMLIATPVSVGVITVFFATKEQANNRRYRIYVPWLSIIGWSLISLLFALETLICVLMLLPICLPLSSLGGFIGGVVRRHYCDKTNQGVASCFALLPFFVIPLEMPIETPTIQKSVTNTVLINADKDVVWGTIPNIKNIKPEELTWNISHSIGLPKPLSARTPSLAVGGIRDLEWEKGVHFQEVISEIKVEELLAYDVLVDQESMKIAELDTHIVVGDKYFDVLSGFYSLDTVDGQTSLTLSTTYRMTTNLNWYGEWLADFVLDDFHSAVLTLIKHRVEGANS